jgi:hypothetical protein
MPWHRADEDERLLGAAAVVGPAVVNVSDALESPDFREECRKWGWVGLWALGTQWGRGDGHRGPILEGICEVDSLLEAGEGWGLH